MLRKLRRRACWCEHCGRVWIEPDQPASVHHIHTNGSGGPDIPENLIRLCPKCHQRAQDGEIPVLVLMADILRSRQLPVRDELRRRWGSAEEMEAYVRSLCA